MIEEKKFKKRLNPPKLQINLSEQQAKDLNKYIPWGLRTRLFWVIIDDLIKIMGDPELGPRFLGGIMSRKIRLDEWVKYK